MKGDGAMRRRTTAEDKATIRRMHGLGHCDLDISTAMAIRQSLVAYHRRKMKLEANPPRKTYYTGKRASWGFSSPYVGADVGQEEAEFGAAMYRWKARYPGRQLGYREMLQVAKGLGYRKVEA